MKIAMISRHLPSGSKIGVGYQAHSLANGLTRRGHTVTMFSQYGPSESALYETQTVPVGTKLRTFRFAWNLRKIDFSSFDLLHAHTDDYWLGGCKKPPHLRTMHGASRAEMQHASDLKSKLRMALLAASEVLATRVADRTVCVSKNTLRFFPHVKEVILNGVDTTLFSPGDDKETRPTLLFVGTYERRKRGRLLMDIFAREILPVLPGAQLWMVSEDAPDAPGVTRFCRIPTAQLAELYRRAWAFCLPSSYEGFGVPYIEAMASGLPVVATPNLGAREVLDEGRYGLLAEPEQLGAALLTLLREAEARQTWSQIGLARAQEFDWEHILDQYERLYAEVGSQHK